MKDSGYYTLIVTSSVFQEKQIIFQVVVKKNDFDLGTASSQCLSQGAVIAPVVILVLIIVLFAVAIVFKRKSKAGTMVQGSMLQCS